MHSEQQGLLFLADISGYTGFLNESELEHAHGTLTDLLEILIDRSGPPLTVSKLEGDAVFSYGFADAFSDGQTLVELIEGTYVSFRRAIDSMVLNNTCQCNACANVSSLDLKFFVHFGSFVFQNLRGREELVGSDVALIHRLMKNTVTEATGMRAYCLYTDAVYEALDLSRIEGLVRHQEEVSDFGTVDVWLHDVVPAYDSASESHDITLNDDEIVFGLEGDLPMSPPVVWDYLSNPGFRSLLIGSDRQELSDLRAGRIGVGTAYQCHHGRQVLPQTILQWDPFTKVVTQDVMPKPMNGTAIAVVTLEPTPTGTRIVRTGGRMEMSGVFRLAGRLGFHKMIRGLASRGFDEFAEAIVTDWQARSASSTPDSAVSAAAIREAAQTSLEPAAGGDHDPSPDG